MPHGYEWLVAWYGAESLWKRAVALVVKNVVEGALAMVCATFLYGIFWIMQDVDVIPWLSPSRVFIGSAFIAGVCFRQAYCWTVTR